ACKDCPKRPTCFDKAGIRLRILASSCYPAFYRGHQRVGTPEFLSMMRLRQIWAEGSFSVLKREHCISKIRKRGILAATEECLLAAMALNLKRMVKAIFFYLQVYYSAGTAVSFGGIFAFVNRSHKLRTQVSLERCLDSVRQRALREAPLRRGGCAGQAGLTSPGGPPGRA
ncbi:MAG: transposase, partial [Evtepia sp.]|nr:transposase [Evtepia sp.]